MAFGLIPDDDTKYCYLYPPPSYPRSQAKRIHRWGPEGQMVDGRPNPSEEFLRLKREGWTDKRFAQILYHSQFDPMEARSLEQVEQLCSDGWSKTPIRKEDASPHLNDAHRQRWLASQKKTKAS